MKYLLKGHAINRANVDAEAVARELENLSEEHDGLTPEVILAAAENSASQLHTLFDWDDSEAARKWRLHQARNLARAIVVVTDEVERAPPRPVFVRTETVYRPVHQVVKREDWYISAMRNLQSKIAQAEQAALALAKAAEQEHPDDAERIARINVVLEAFRTCTRAVESLH